MINEKNVKKYCKDYTKIENYQKAIEDDRIYDCHHRKETDENKTRQQLIDEGLYYDRPADEFIYLTHDEHIKLHMVGYNRKSIITRRGAKRFKIVNGRRIILPYHTETA